MDTVGGGFFLTCEDFREKAGPFNPHLHYFLKWRFACAHQFHSLGQDQSTVAQRTETTVAKCSPDQLWV